MKRMTQVLALKSRRPWAVTRPISFAVVETFLVVSSFVPFVKSFAVTFAPAFA